MIGKFLSGLLTAGMLLGAPSCWAQEGNVGQQNVVNVGNSNSGERWVSQPYRYYSRGCWHTGYRRVPATAAAVTQSVTPVGSINTDNSSTYNYTYTINYSQLPTAQGSTLYGQAPFTETADIYGNVDLGVYYDQAIRALADSGKLHDSAIQGTLSLLDKAGANQARVAETLARGEADARRFSALAELAKANNIGASAHVQRSYSSQHGSGQTTVAAATATTTGAGDLGALQVVFNANCVKCHGGVKTEAGLDLRDVSRLEASTGAKILERITTLDPAKRMPRTEDGKAGSLSLDDLKTIYKFAQ